MSDDIVDAEFEEIEAGERSDVSHDATTYNNTEALMTRLSGASTQAELLEIIAEARKNGDMNKQAAAYFRSDMGIHKSSFTKKSPTATQRKTKRKLQKAARKKQRK